MTRAFTEEEAKLNDRPLRVSHRRAVVGRRTKFYRSYSPGVWSVSWSVWRDGRLMHTVIGETIRTGIVCDFETTGTYTIRVEVYDFKGNVFNEGSDTFRVYAHPVLPQRLLEGVAYAGARAISLAASASAAFGDVAWRARKGVLAAAALLGALGLVATAYLAVTAPGSTWRFVAPRLGYVGTVLAAMAIVSTALMLGFAACFGVAIVGPRVKQKLRPVGGGVKRGGFSFRQAMRLGYVAVKSRTCPRLVVADDEEETGV